MPFIPYPDQVPGSVRTLGRKLLPIAVRTRGVQLMLWAAQAQLFWTPSYRANANRIENLRDHHKGETCIIMGNGPSLAGTDPSLLRGFPVFGLNRGYLLWRKWENFTPTYFVAVNDLVIEQFNSDIAALDCPKFLPWRHRHLFDDTDDYLFLPQSYRPAFGIEPAKGLWSGGTVTFAAMQLAYFLGFSKVVLIGVDHYFDSKGPNNAEVIADGPDHNHFDAEYFGKGIRWNLPDLPLSEQSYALARETFKADGREIVNATDGGRLEIFRRQTLQEALSTGVAR